MNEVFEDVISVCAICGSRDDLHITQSRNIMGETIAFIFTCPKCIDVIAGRQINLTVDEVVVPDLKTLN